MTLRDWGLSKQAARRALKRAHWSDPTGPESQLLEYLLRHMSITGIKQLPKTYIEGSKDMARDTVKTVQDHAQSAVAAIKALQERTRLP